ncbi:recombinase family protein [Vibrio sp. CUB2]|uniref:recombinase family protein n=1 Tax=Vibrio sp. CUB2 TaxID=2315233 RepID=UPI00076A9591|nr:recombinase family protein [Vibrio sp. CUB2]
MNQATTLLTDTNADTNKGRTFLYARVSTTEQTTENQVLAVRNRGYDIRDDRVISETVSGSVEAMKRKEFKNMIENKMEDGDTLVVLKLDRLGRDNIDVQTTINLLQSKGIKVVCLDLPHPDLSSTEGKLMMQMFAAFAEFERNRIRERTKDGLERAKSQGRVGGRPKATSKEQVLALKEDGKTQKQVAEILGIGIATVQRNWK